MSHDHNPQPPDATRAPMHARPHPAFFSAKVLAAV